MFLLPNIVEQIVQLEAQVVKHTSQLLEFRKLHKSELLKGVKVGPPSRFNGVAVRDLFKNFIEALENYYNFKTTSDPNQQSRGES